MPSMTVDEALKLVLGFVGPLPSERVPLLDALNRVLAEDATSDIDVAPMDDSATDDFAACVAETVDATAGAPVRAGDVVLRAGEVVEAAAIGLLAATGHSTVAVHRRPRVGVLATGSELVEVAEKPGPGKIRNSNSYSMAAQVLAAGGIPVRYGIVPDDEDATEAALGRAADECDFILTSGGVSAGDFDFVKRVLEQAGESVTCEVDMRPGKPQTLGTFRGVPFYGLPGNPASTYVGFEVFVRPALRVMQGFSAIARPVTKARLLHDVTKKPDRRDFLRGHVRRASEGIGYTAALVGGGRSSAFLEAGQSGNCFVVLPEGDGLFPAGTLVDCVRLDMDEGTP